MWKLMFFPDSSWFCFSPPREDIELRFSPYRVEREEFVLDQGEINDEGV